MDENDIRRLDVAVNQVIPLHRPQRLRRLLAEQKHIQRIHRPVLLDILLRARAVAELHGIKHALGRVAEEKHIRHIGMADASHALRLLQKPLPRLRPPGMLRRHHLHHRKRQQIPVKRFVSHPHRALAQQMRRAISPREDLEMLKAKWGSHGAVARRLIRRNLGLAHENTVPNPQSAGNRTVYTRESKPHYRQGWTSFAAGSG